MNYVMYNSAEGLSELGGIRLQRSVLVAEMHIYFVAPFLATHNYSNLVCGGR